MPFKSILSHKLPMFYENLITMTTESDGIKLYNRKTGKVFRY